MYRADSLNSIESRIKRMEALLQSSGIFINSPQEEAKKSPSESIDGQRAVTSNNELANLMISDAGEQKYIGASSGFSLLSPRGLAWVQRKTGSDRLGGILQKLKSSGQLWPRYGLGRWLPGAGLTKHLLPSEEVARQLVMHYFNSFNGTFPLFDRKAFFAYFDRQYSNDPPKSRSWYGALNIVLSIGCVIATDSTCFETIVGAPVTRADFVELSWRFFQNASSVLLDLLFLDNDLMAVQTLIGMAFVLQAVPNPEASFFLIAAAARIGHAMGLHRWLEGFGVSQAELEQRRRVFWIIYIIEKSTCIRIGRPSAINDDDIGVGLPPEDLHAEGDVGIHVPSAPGQKFYPFRTMCAVALIESRVYRELYSTKSQTKTAGETLLCVGLLDQELQEWKDTIPLEIRPEHQIQCEREHRFAIIMLHFVYYNCVTAIHRVSVYHGSWTSNDGNPGNDAAPLPSTPASSTSSTLSPRVYASYALCLSAARSIIHLASHFLDSEDDPRNSLIWIALYFPLSACLTLFAHALQSPRDPRADSDLGLMERTLKYLSRPSDIDNKATSVFILEVFGELLTIAREHVKNATSSTQAASTYHSPPGRVSEAQQSSDQPPLPNGIQNPGIPEVPNDSTSFSSRPLYSEHSPVTRPRSPSSATDPTILPSNFSGYPTFNFLPFDTIDPTFMTNPDLSQFDFLAAMNDDWGLLARNQYA